MNQDMYDASMPAPQKPKGSNTWLIVLIVVVVLCCLCAIVLGMGWQFGDQIMQMLGVTY